MGNACCSRQQGYGRMAVMTDPQKKVILANDSTCIGVLLVCYRVLVILYLVASLAPNFAVQRDPVGGPDPTVFRFSALPHVIWMISPIIMLAYAERARLLDLFADRQSAKYLRRRINWAIFFAILDILVSAVHFTGFLVEGIMRTSPLFNDPNTEALVWTGLAISAFQFLWVIWILLKFLVFGDNLRVALEQGLPFSSSNIEDGISKVPVPSAPRAEDLGLAKQIGNAILGTVGIGSVFKADKKRLH